jgi:hydroxymethylpyrimidine/phosphomethylpyrimidine kinase
VALTGADERRRPVALTIGGSDSGGGAGIVADLKTFEAYGVWGTVAVVAVAAQNTLGIQAAATLSPYLVKAQIASVAGDLGVDAAKTGMLATAALITTVASAIREAAIDLLVVDPVLVSGPGDALLAEDALDALRNELLPLAAFVTPNLAEAAALTGRPVRDRAEMIAAAEMLAGLGPQTVLVTGGGLEDDVGSPDLLWSEGLVEWLEGPRLDAGHAYGRGGVLSAAITAELAWGTSPAEAAASAKRFVGGAIAAGVDLGAGVGPIDPGWQP